MIKHDIPSNTGNKLMKWIDDSKAIITGSFLLDVISRDDNYVGDIDIIGSHEMNIPKNFEDIGFIPTDNK
jgi:hypothetical protein